MKTFLFPRGRNKDGVFPRDVAHELGRYFLEEASLSRLQGCWAAADRIARSNRVRRTSYAGQAVAHLLRESLAEISRAAHDPTTGRWQTLSDEVVQAKTRLEAASPDQRDSVYQELLDAIDDLENFKKVSERKHERGLVNLVANTTGATVMTGTAREYGRLVRSLSSAAHSSRPLEDVLSVRAEAIKLLKLLFGPPVRRVDRLVELAQLNNPTQQEVAETISLITTDYELRRFLASVRTSAWLWKLEWYDGLRPTNRSWPVIILSQRLGKRESRALTGWLKEAFHQHWGSDQLSAEAIASAAAHLDVEGHSILLQALKEHPGSEAIRWEVSRAVELAPADSQFVEEAFEILARRLRG